MAGPSYNGPVGELHGPSGNLENIFPGTSEMAQLMRAFDWSTSEAGDPARWPESLKAAVRIHVGSRNPIVIWWGRTALTQDSAFGVRYRLMYLRMWPIKSAAIPRRASLR